MWISVARALLLWSGVSLSRLEAFTSLLVLGTALKLTFYSYFLFMMMTIVTIHIERWISKTIMVTFSWETSKVTAHPPRRSSLTLKVLHFFFCFYTFSSSSLFSSPLGSNDAMINESDNASLGMMTGATYLVKKESWGVLKEIRADTKAWRLRSKDPVAEFWKEPWTTPSRPCTQCVQSQPLHPISFLSDIHHEDEEIPCEVLTTLVSAKTVAVEQMQLFCVPQLLDNPVKADVEAWAMNWSRQSST